MVKQRELVVMEVFLNMTETLNSECTKPKKSSKKHEFHVGKNAKNCSNQYVISCCNFPNVDFLKIGNAKQI